MKVLSYKQAAERIAWERELRLSALRDDILSAVAHRLRSFPPNTLSNIKHPWKLSERFSLRPWCPLHEGRWAKLIVRADEDGQVTYDCSRGCAHDEVSSFLNDHAARAGIVRIADTIATSTSCKSTDAAGVIYAEHRFGNHRKISGPRRLDFDDPAA